MAVCVDGLERHDLDLVHGLQADVARHVVGRIGDEIRHHIERLPLQRRLRGRLVMNVRMNDLCALGHARVRVAAVEQRQIPSPAYTQR